MTLEQIQALSDGDLREIIGTLQGWDCDPVEARDWNSRGQWAVAPGDAARKLTSKRMDLPNYPADLNACADLWRIATEAGKDRLYWSTLEQVVASSIPHCITPAPWDTGNAKARPRCEAFLAVMGKEDV